MQTREEVETKIRALAAEDDEFRKLVLDDPRQAVSNIAGVTIPDSITLMVHEENSTSFHLVLPPSDRLTHSELTSVAGGSEEPDTNDPPTWHP